jgi:hypothetical protein
MYIKKGYIMNNKAQSIKCAVTCKYCGDTFFLVKSKAKLKIDKLTFCNRKCTADYFTGSNNPNYGNSLSQEAKDKISAASKNMFVAIDSNGNKIRISNDDPRYISGEFIAESSGRILPQHTRDAMSKSKAGIQPHTFTEETRNKISIASKANWKSASFRDKTRKTRELKGQWVPLDQKDKYKLYFEACKFKHSFYDYATPEEIAIVKEYGIFNASSNSKGCVRDHLYSRRSGFENNVDPDIISHPANSEIILHSENVRRAHSKYGDDQITLKELLLKIERW